MLGFINDEVLSRGAAMAFFAVTSLAPIVLIVVAIAGLVFGREAAQNALVEQLRGIMGEQSAQLIQSAAASAGNQTVWHMGGSYWGPYLFVTASGVFGEMQSALNVIWKTEPDGFSHAPHPRAGDQPRPSRSARLPADCLAGDQRADFRLRPGPQCLPSIRRHHSRDHQRADCAGSDRGALFGHLQAAP